ncbi:sugar transferase [Defluviitalea saccharophila]|uniref:Sugar transferase n=1 Tax=Defluviitalea saccharophila TaxID=879970 RepID=A0ABZ2Y6B0_9FIRM|nr:sugar transferase [Candidatus Epulonipiscium sp.]
MKEIQIMIKHGLDKLIAFILFIAVSPIFFIIALGIKLTSKGPVFFIQERVGKDGKDFKIYKFRTMIQNAVNMGNGIYTEENDPRITKIGRILRKTSLDELPQLINILKGDMSIIGPRPTLRYQVEKYNEFQMQRLKMRPGVTGLAQVNGRNSLPWAKRIEYDVEYVNNYSLWLDLKIIIKTVKVVLTAEGVYGQRDEMM